MPKLQTNIKTTIAIFWTFIVIFSWWKSHTNGLFQSLWGYYPSFSQLVPLFVMFLVIASLIGYTVLIKKESSIKVKAPAIGIFFIFLFFCYLVFSFLALKVSPYTGEFAISPDKLSVAYLYFSKKFAFHLFWIFIFTLSFSTLGKSIRKFFILHISKKSNLLSVLFQLSLGIFGWSILAFILGIYGFLNIKIFLFLLLISFLIEIKYVIEIIKKIFKPLFFNIKLKNLKIWLFSFMVLISIMNLIDSLRPVPTGYDDATTYLNNVNKMTQQESLVSNKRPLPFELLGALGQTVSQNSSLAIALAFIFSILGTLAVYGLTKHLYNKKIAFLSAFLWHCLPFISEVVFQQVKPDLMMFFFSIMSLWFFFLWLKEKRIHQLYASAFLAGFACTIKLTAAFLLPAMGILYLFSWKAWDGKLKTKLKISLVAVFLALIPALPWVGLNLTKENQKNIPLERFDNELPISHKEWTMQKPNEDLSRYKSSSILRNVFFLWDATMNNRVSHISVEIGFFFLSMILVFLLWIKNLYKSFYYTKHLLIISIIYWSAWIVWGKQVLWYGYLGFFLLILLFSGIFLSESIPKKLRLYLIFILIFSALSGGIMRIWLFGDYRLPRYLSNTTGINSLYYPEVRELTDIINEHPKEKVLISAGNFPYFIKKNPLMRDQLLNTFSFLNQENNADVTLKRLNILKVKYILIDYSMEKMEKNSDGTLHKKVTAFKKFAQEKLQIKESNGTVFLYEVPVIF